MKVAILMGSRSDLPTLSPAIALLRKKKVKVEAHILSAHRTPNEVAEFAEKARKKGFVVIIAGAGGAAHLPGLVASHTDLPVIGVPVEVTPLGGADALLSILQMPRGIPVGTVGVSGARAAGEIALRILNL